MENAMCVQICPVVVDPFLIYKLHEGGDGNGIRFRSGGDLLGANSLVLVIKCDSQDPKLVSNALKKHLEKFWGLDEELAVPALTATHHKSQPD
jgi:hypothetical protein